MSLQMTIALTVPRTRPFGRDVWKCVRLYLIWFMFGLKKKITTYMKFASTMVFVCFNYSTSYIVTTIFLHLRICPRSETGKTSCVMTHRWRVVPRDCNKKAHCNLNYVWTWSYSHQPLFYQIAKIERCGNCWSRNLTYKFCIGMH